MEGGKEMQLEAVSEVSITKPDIPEKQYAREHSLSRDGGNTSDAVEKQ